MADLVFLLWFVFSAFFVLSYSSYFGYLRFKANMPWGFEIDSKYCPSITILVPAYNEEKMIRSKLENLVAASYPKQKLEVILIDDGSTDQTFARAQDFIEDNPEFPIRILEQGRRTGKANALNSGLEISDNEIVVVTDADTLWSPNTLLEALPYMSQGSVGAITGRTVPMSFGKSWVTEAEEDYLSFISLLRQGESKIHSTIRFEGGFCAFRRVAFDKFDNESGADDSGTALRIVQNRFRAIFLPEVRSFSEFPTHFGDRIKVKTRRALHLNGLWIHCLGLLFNGRLMLPKRITIPEIFVSIINPTIFFFCCPIDACSICAISRCVGFSFFSLMFGGFVT